MEPIALITRPAADAAGLADRVAVIGFLPMLAPLMEIAFTLDRDIDLNGVGGLAFTSSNGVRAFVAWMQETGCHDAAWRQRLQAVPAFAVGDATMTTARTAGFETVLSASGDVEGLAALIGSHRERLRGGSVLHVRGKAAAGDLVALLEQYSVSAGVAKLYEARLMDQLPTTAKRALQAPEMVAVMLYSPRTAGHFVELVRQAALEEALSHCAAVCLSPAVAERVEGLPFAWTVVAARPDTDSLLNAMVEIRGC